MLWHTEIPSRKREAQDRGLELRAPAFGGVTLCQRREKQMSANYHLITHEISWRDVVAAWLVCIIVAAISLGLMLDRLASDGVTG
jgi:hypothetical protein